MRIIDASVLVKICIEERSSAAARAEFISGERYAAPAHALAEVAEVLARKVRDGQALLPQIIQSIRAVEGEIEFLKVSDLIETAMEISITTGASVYDCLYVTAARRFGCLLITADTRLISRLAGTRYEPLLIPLDSANAPR